MENNMNKTVKMILAGMAIARVVGKCLCARCDDCGYMGRAR